MNTIVKILGDARERAEGFARKAVQDLYLQLLSGAGCSPDPIHGIGYRIKTPAAMAAKLESDDSERGARTINDYIGIRVLAMHSKCLHDIESHLTPWSNGLGLLQVKRQDKIGKPDVGGYRAIHIDYVIEDPEREQLPPETTLECQLTTWLQHLHGMISHRLAYKANELSTSIPIRELELLSADLWELDKRVAGLLQGG